MKSQLTTWLLVCTLGLATVLAADFLGIKKAGEYVGFPVHPPMDSAGIPGTPDSIQVVTYADNGATKAYSATGSGYTCAGIDTTSDFGRDLIWFADQIQDIDGAGGNIELAIQVVTWYKKLPTYTFATVQVITDSLNVLSSIKTAMDAAPTVDQMASRNADTMNARGEVAIKTNGIATTSFQDAAITAAKTSGISTFDPTADTVKAKANVKEWADVPVHNSQGNTGGDTLPHVNVKQISDDAVAPDNEEAAFDGTGYAGGTIKQSVDATLISGSAPTADNLEAALTGSGNAVNLSLKQVNIQNNTGTALVVASTGADGDGARFAGNGTGDGIEAVKGVGTGARDFNSSISLDDLVGTLDAGEVGVSTIMKFWNIPFDTTHTAGSIFDSLCSLTYMQGAAGTEVWTEPYRDSVLAALRNSGFRSILQAVNDSLIAKYGNRKAFDWLTDTVIVDLSGVATKTGQDSIFLMIDDFSILSGYKIGARSILHAHPDVDTMWVYDGVVLKAVVIARHIGRTAAAYPDSTRTNAP